MCVLYVVGVYAPTRRLGLPLRMAGLVESRIGDPLLLCLLVQL